MELARFHRGGPGLCHNDDRYWKRFRPKNIPCVASIQIIIYCAWWVTLRKFWYLVDDFPKGHLLSEMVDFSEIIVFDLELTSLDNNWRNIKEAVYTGIITGKPMNIVG